MMAPLVEFYAGNRFNRLSRQKYKEYKAGITLNLLISLRF